MQSPLALTSKRKPCPNENSPEIKVVTDWSSLLNTVQPPTAQRALTRDAYTQYKDNKLLILDRVFTEEECVRLNEAAESIGYGKTNYPEEYRGNLRLISTDVGLAQALWERLRPFVPHQLEANDGYGCSSAWTAVGLNECFRLAKYKPGTRFESHVDANFIRNENEMSLFTVNIYTNSVSTNNGGKTRFFKDDERFIKTAVPESNVVLEVQPEVGVAVLFLQPPQDYVLHDGEELTGGVKYLLRSDVMYRRCENHPD